MTHIVVVMTTVIFRDLLDSYFKYGVFFSDLLLCFDMFDHCDQSSINNPDKNEL